MTPDLHPAGDNAIAAAAQWLEGTLLGSFATVLAVIAVALVGILLLSGRLDVRRGVQVVFGCFTIFGASAIASGLAGAMTGRGEAPPVETASQSPMQADPQAIPRPQPAAPYDPYAGAAMPARR
jgi:type IV secretory pathway VirB2 component (pilin)